MVVVVITPVKMIPVGAVGVKVIPDGVKIKIVGVAGVVGVVDQWITPRLPVVAVDQCITPRLPVGVVRPVVDQCLMMINMTNMSHQ
jgi:hypothetical protein